MSDPDPSLPSEPVPPVGPPDPPPRARRVDLTHPELVWPLSLVAGFGGCFLGVLTGLPAVPAVIATAGFAPIFVRLQSRGRPVAAFLCSVAWLLGMIAALVGAALEGSVEAVREVVPLAPSFVSAEWGFLDGFEPASPWPAVGRNLLVLVVLVLLARPYVGIVAVLLAALVANLLGAGAAGFVARAVEDDWNPSMAALAGLPPHLFLGLLGGLAVAAVVAAPGRLLPLRSLARERRLLLLIGAAVGTAAIVLEPVIAPFWRSQLS